MHTISFYSFKGGVGRSMAVYYLAQEFAKLGKRVVVADFDFEAPGLPYKFKVPQTEISAGLIDYIHTFFTESRIPDSIAIDCKPVPDMGTAENPVLLLPSGASHLRNYWQKLHEIDWKQLLYQQESYGRAFFLEWKLRLEEELKPDILLIDSRTGIHDLTAVTMHLLSDQVLVLGVNNEENIDGCRLLLEILKDNQDPIREGKAISAHFALTRLPIPGPSFNYKQEQEICTNVKNRINTGRNLASGDLVEVVHVIHSDDRLLINEKSLTEEPREDYWRVERDLLRVLFAMCESANLLVEGQLIRLKETTQIEHLIKLSQAETNYSSAFDLIEKALKIAPENPHVVFAKGVNLFKSGKYELSIDCFTYASQQFFNSPNSFYYRSWAKEKLKDFEGSITDAETAIQIGPKLRHVHYHLARLYYNERRFADAAAVAANLILLPTANHFDFSLAGDIELANNDAGAAKNYFQKAIEINPEYTPAYSKIASILTKERRPGTALQFLSKAIEIDPENASIHLNIGNVHADMKNYGLAITALKNCLAHDPQNAEALISLAEAYFKASDYTKSKAMLAKAKQIRPNDKRLATLQNKLPR